MDHHEKQYDVFLIGDLHSVTAFRIAGYKGYIAEPDTIRESFDLLVSKNEIGILLITRELAALISDKIKRVNFDMDIPVIIEIQGIDDTSSIDKSILSYVNEALGIAI